MPHSKWTMQPEEERAGLSTGYGDHSREDRLCTHCDSLRFLRGHQLGRRRGDLKKAASGIWW